MSAPVRHSEKGSEKSNVPPKSDRDAISISSDSHLAVSSDARSHISISSDSRKSVIVISDSSSVQEVNPKPTNKVAMYSLQKKNFKARAPPAMTAKTSVKRKQQSTTVAGPASYPLVAVAQRQPALFSLPPPRTPSLKRKLNSQSDSDDSMHEICHVPLPSRLPSPPLMTPLSITNQLPNATSRGHSSTPPSPSKRLRLSPPMLLESAAASGNEADVEEVIPSSQSDEQELSMPKVLTKDPAEVKENVDRWRKETSVVSPEPAVLLTAENEPVLHDAGFEVMVDSDVNIIDSSTMDTGGEESATPIIHSTSASEAEVSIQLHPHSSSQSALSASRRIDTFSPASVARTPDPSTKVTPPRGPAIDYRVLTPPPSDPAPMPATPVALDGDSKLAEVIAKIRADAIAAVQSSSVEDDDDAVDSRDIPDHLSDSSSDEPDGAFFDTKGKGKVLAGRKIPAALSSSPLSNLESSPPADKRSGRYNFRHSRNSSSRSPGQAAPTQAVTVLRTVNNNVRRVTAKKKTANPLDVLLNEKKRDDKHGKGAEALRSAEAAIAASTSKSTMRMEMDEEEVTGYDDGRWGDEDAAMQVVREGARGLSKRSSSSPHAPHSDDESESEKVPDEDYCQKVLGKDGKKIGKILERDRSGQGQKGKGKKKEAEQGVLLWETWMITRGRNDQDKTRAEGLPQLPFSETDIGNNGLLCLLRTAIKNNDVIQLSSILQLNVVLSLGAQHCAALSPWLFQLATSPRNIRLGESSYLTLLQLAESENHHVSLPFTLALSTIVRLGAKKEALGAFGWSLPNGVQPDAVTENERTEIVYRIIRLVAAFARNNALSPEALPDFVALLLLIALDPCTPGEMKTDVMITVDTLGSSIPHDASSNMEAQISTKILPFAESLEPINKAFLLVFFSGGCSPISRVARWLAHAMVLNVDGNPVGTYNPLPSLAPLVKLLSSSPSSETLFDVMGNSENTNYYEDLAFYVEILGTALSDIEAYAEEEVRFGRLRTTNVLRSPRKDKAATELEAIKRLLEELHGKIVDTQTAHLDRSRAKAALQQLSFRVHYQRQSALQSNSVRNLHGYFARPNK